MSQSPLFRTDVDSATLDRGWDGIRSKRTRRQRQRRMLWGAPVVVAVLVLLATGWGRREKPPLALEPHVLALATGGALPSAWSVDSATTVAFDDGSHVDLASGAQLRAGAVADPKRVNLALERGSVTFDIRPGGPRAWIIDAGDTQVRVLGTRFTVEHDGPHVAVAVERGKVRVEGVRVSGGGRDLVAGERIDLDEKASPPPEPAIAVANLPTAAPPVEHRRAAPREVVSAAVTTEPESEPVDDLARADAARKAGQPRGALAILQSVVDSHGPNAALAAFTMGKIHSETLGEPAVAATWFERAIRLGLPVGLDEDALARVVECHARAGARSEAAKAALRYEARFPAGRHLARVRSWKSE